MPTGAAGKSIMRMKGLGMKKGGEAKHPDVAEDKKLIKKMVKPSAMKREEHCGGGKAGKRGKYGTGGGPYSDENGRGSKSPTSDAWFGMPGSRQRQSIEAIQDEPDDLKRGLKGSAYYYTKMIPDIAQDAIGSFGTSKDDMQGRKRGGGVFSGNSKEKIPGATGGRKAKMGGGGFRSELTQYEKARRPAVEAGQEVDIDENDLRKKNQAFERAADETGYSNRKHGGRSKHAKGGKVKGKTEIKIMIAPHTGQPQGGPQQPMGGMMPPMPVPQPNKPMQPNQPAGLDPNLAMAAIGASRGAAPQPQPPMPMPMGRKAGGRVQTQHVINNAAGGGLGRLEKIKAYGHKAK
jgi:hypothetical protein